MNLSRGRSALLVVGTALTMVAGAASVTVPAAAATTSPNGVVLGWGADWYGEVTPPAGLGVAKAIAASGTHSLAVRADGTVAAWGLDDVHQTDVPAGLDHVVAVAAGIQHSLALRDDGTVVAWGNDDLGQVTPPPGLSHVRAIAAGGNQSVALKTDGTVAVWGDTAPPPAGLGNVVAISAGDLHCLALKADGTVVAWGGNAAGQATVPAGLRAKSIAAAVDYSAAVRTDGTVVVWGNRTYVTLPAGGLAHVAAVAAGDQHGVALLDDGRLTVWGNRAGGRGAVPSGLRGVSAIAAGGGHSLVLATSAVSFRSATTSVGENAGRAYLTVTRTDTAIPASVTYRRTGGTASGTDATVAPGRLDFAVGQATRAIAVNVTNDAAAEAAETVVITLAAAGVGTVLGPLRSTTLVIGTSDQRPDALISRTSSSDYVGNNVYNVTGYRQTRARTAHRGQARDFYVRVYNDGNARTTFVVKGSAAAARSSVRYYAGRTDVTRAMRSTTGLRTTLAAHAYKLLRVRITLARNAVIGSLRPALVTARWSGDIVRLDAVKAVVKAVR